LNMNGFATISAVALPGVPSLAMALAVTLAFAGLGHLVRGVTFSGAVAGGIICFVLYVRAGKGAFFSLVSVFILTWVATRAGYRRKQISGTAENRGGRTAGQVLANLAVAACCAAAFAVTTSAAFLNAIAGALSEAAADTVSSEFGQARRE